MSVIIYTAVFAVYFLIAFGGALAEYGYIVGADGMNQYVPFLTELRRSLLLFFDSLASGSPQLPMIELSYAYGGDIPTMIGADFAPMLPLFALSCLFPEELIPQFITAAMTLFTYISGISFICMCEHFRKNTMLAGALAFIYVFCGNYWSFGMMNPHFLYMFMAFPLMIIGIDRIIQGRNGILFALCIAFLTLCGIHLLFYTVPFVIIFAAIRVFYVYRDTYLRSLLKYFVSGFMYTVLGMITAGVMLLPFMYTLMTSEREFGSSGVPLWEMLIPDINSIYTIFAGEISEENAVGVCLAAMPFLLYALVFPETKREHRSYCIASLVLSLLPLTSYAVNGFQYALCRWGLAPALLTAFICVEYVPAVLRSGRREMNFFISVLALYVISFTLDLDMWSVVPLLAIIVLSLFPRVRKWFAGKVPAAVSKYRAALDGEKRFIILLATALAALAAVIGILLIIVCGGYRINPALIIAAALTVTASICAYKKTPRGVPALILAASFVISGVLYIPDSSFTSVKERNTAEEELYSTLAAQLGKQDGTARLCPVFPEYQNVDPEEGDTSNVISSMLLNSQTDHMSNIALTYDFAECDIFNSLISGNYMRFMGRMGQTWEALRSTGEVWGFAGNDALYSLFGVGYYFAPGDTPPYLYGISADRTLTSGDGTLYTIYKNDFALPAGITYDTEMSEDDYNAIDPAVLPFEMMNKVWLDGYSGEAAASGNDDRAYRCGTELTQELRGVTSAGVRCYDNTVTINTENENCFLFMDLNGVNSVLSNLGAIDRFSVIVNDSRAFKFKITCNDADWEWARSSDHYTLALGMCEGRAEKITFVSPFEFESLSVYAVPESVFTDAYHARCSETLGNIRTDINTLSGSIDLSAARILSVNLLYSPGWTAYVDGAQATVYKANGLFLGIPLSAGHHDIKLVYHTPLIYEGAALSCIGIAIIIAIAVISARKERKQRK